MSAPVTAPEEWVLTPHGLKKVAGKEEGDAAIEKILQNRKRKRGPEEPEAEPDVPAGKFAGRADLRAWQTEVDDFGAQGLDKKAGNSYKTNALEKLGVKAATGPRTSASPPIYEASRLAARLAHPQPFVFFLVCGLQPEGGLPLSCAIAHQ